MSAFSDYLENALINHVLRNTALSAPASVLVALFTTNPLDDASGTEVSGGSYARQTVSTTGGWNAPSGGATANTADITFPVASSGWGTVTHFGIYDAGGTNLLFHGALTASKLVASGDTFRFPASSLTITLA